MFLSRLVVQGYRAAALDPLECHFSGRFSLLLGSNGSGKTTISEAIYQAHVQRFPRLPQVDAATLGPSPRSVSVEYAFEENQADEGALGSALRAHGDGAPRWSRTLERSLGKVRATSIDDGGPGLDSLRLVYLPALRNPVDELSRRDAQVLIELLRAEQARRPGGGGLPHLRAKAQEMLRSLSTQQLMVDLQSRIGATMSALTAGVTEHFPFIGTQHVDDAYLARVLELLLATLPDPAAGLKLEASSLGYVNLLHIAVTLAGIPDPGDVGNGGPNSRSTEQTSSDEGDDRSRLEAITEQAEDDKDSFFSGLFHATVVVEEPEAHLHPQLQYGLVRYLQQVAKTRRDLQIIVATHSAELISACDPNDLVIVRRNAEGKHVTRTIGDIPAPNRAFLLQQTRLHLDATRSSALFGDRLLLVEGVTEAVIVRVLARRWAGEDSTKVAFVDALSILPLGHKIGEWPMRLLATPGFEVVTRVAALGDTDKRGEAANAFTPPSWHGTLDESTARFFWSRPTLEPTLVPGNEGAVQAALNAGSFGAPPPVSATGIDDFFQSVAGRPKKGEFAVLLAGELANHERDVVIPPQIEGALDWLYGTNNEKPPTTNEQEDTTTGGSML